MRIKINSVPHEAQRYETVGDWWYTGGETLHITVSELKDFNYEALVGIHEFVEALLCKARGISEESVTAFDMIYERDREAGLHKPDEEPGNDYNAPYYKEHQIATKIERILAEELGVDWDEYDKAVTDL